MVADLDDFVLRRNDFSLEEERRSLRDAFRAFFERNCPADRVRAAEPLGFDAALWSDLAALRAIPMGVPAGMGGDEAGMVELVLVCEEAGRRAAPVPVVETLVAARLLAAVGTDAARAALAKVLDGAAATVAITAPAGDGRVLTPAGAIAEIVLGVQGDSLVLLTPTEQAAPLPNLGSAPVAWCDLSGGDVLATGRDAAAYQLVAEAEWRVLTAALLVGLGEAALVLGVRYAKERSAFGVPIGTFQAVAHPLVDAAIAVEAARSVTRKAAWFADVEPDSLGTLPSMAFVAASEAAERAGSTAIHTQGGFGFTLESDVQLFYRRAKGTSLLGGDRRAELQRIGRRVAADGGVA